MLKTQINGAKYLSPQTSQMTNLNIAVPADSKDTEFGTSDILLAKDVIAYLNTLDSDISKELATKANKSDALLKKSDSGGYYIEENSNELGYGAFAVNSQCTASGMSAYAECAAIASGDGSHAEGYNTTASGNGSHAEGNSTTASGNESHAEGYSTTASDFCSHAEGYNTTASNEDSHAEGYNTTASGFCSHAEGYNTTASGNGSHAEGGSTTASGEGSHAEGYGTTASGFFSHAEGAYNVEDTHAIHSVGIGTDSISKNAEYIYVRIDESGEIDDSGPKNGYKYLIGVGGYDGISTDTSTYKSVQEVIADLTARIEQLETKIKALEDANTPA